MDEFLEYARTAYGDLRSPDYSFFGEALRTQPWREVIQRLRSFLKVEEWTDREDDVSFSYVLRSGRKGPGWDLWISTVGPFAFLAGLGPTAQEIQRSDVVTEAHGSLEARIVAVLHDAGLRLLSADEVESTVDFRTPDGRFPVSLFVVLFGESDVPWWHAG